MPDWLRGEMILGLPAWDWLIAVLLSAGLFVVMSVARRFIMERLAKRAEQNDSKYSKSLIELVSATNLYLFAAVAIIIGIGILDLPARWSTLLSHCWFVVLALQTGLWLHRVVTIWKRDHLFKRSSSNMVMATLITTFVDAVIWIVIVLAILENDGVNITTLVASLGIGGVAIALAMQTILGDLFAAISIAVDKPFQVGDSITAGDTSGTVERIGLKSTHIRSVSGEQVVCSNMDLLKRTIQNFQRMTERRIVFRFNLAYRTPIDVAEQIPGAVKKIIEGRKGTRFGRAHLVKLGTAAMEYEVVYTVLDVDYQNYMDTQQFINIAIMKQLMVLGADIALPDGNPATSSIKLAAEDRPTFPKVERRVQH